MSIVGLAYMHLYFVPLTPAAEGHGLWPWMNASRQWTGDVAPLGREVGDHGLYPWGSTVS